MKSLPVAIAAIALAACGGGDGGTTAPPPPPPPPSVTTPDLVSTASPFSAGCGLGTGTVYINAEVEPHLAVNPRNAGHLVGVWQQDRWSNGSARGLGTAISFDGGATWAYRQLPFSLCSGGRFERTTDPWVTFGSDGTVHQMALVTSGESFVSGSENALLASRSTDGGLTWSAPATLISDTAPFFNDKNSITADPTDARYVYAAWDRLNRNGHGPAYFARSIDGGLSWEAARQVFDPGNASSIIGALVVVLPDGALAYLFTRFDPVPGGGMSAALFVMRSTDKGATWSPPARVADLLGRGARDPETGTVVRDGSILAQMAAAPDGSLHVVWQDARFSGGVRDAIALSRSVDGGLGWSPPVRVNPDSSVAAFTPQVQVRADGTIGVTYYDFRSNTADPATLLTDYWIARSTDGVNWNEARVADPFNLSTAPLAGGLFLGDYMGLASVGTAFLPFYARTTGDLVNRTDVFLTRIDAAPALPDAAPDPKRALALESRLPSYRAQAAPEFVADAVLRQRVAENIVRALQARGRARSQSPGEPPPS